MDASEEEELQSDYFKRRRPINRYPQCLDEGVQVGAIDTDNSSGHLMINSRFKLLPFDLVKKSDIGIRGKKINVQQKNLNYLQEIYRLKEQIKSQRKSFTNRQGLQMLKDYSVEKKNIKKSLRFKTERNKESYRHAFSSIKEKLNINLKIQRETHRKAFFTHKKEGSKTITRLQMPEESEQQAIIHFPIIKQKRRSISQRNPSRSIADISFSTKPKISIRAASARATTIKKFKRTVNAVLFTIYLSRFNEKMRIHRVINFNIFCREKLPLLLLELKNDLVMSFQRILSTILDKCSVDYCYEDHQAFKLQPDSIKTFKKILKMILESLEKCLYQQKFTEHYKQLFYYTCRHGSYGCLNFIYTAEQMKVVSISKKHGYMTADKHLQKSSILMLLFIKMLVFNIFLNPEKSMEQFKLKLNAKLKANLKLIGNILYQLFIQIQDNLLEKSPETYQIGNWESLKQVHAFKLAQSMHSQGQNKETNELITGLLHHKYIQNTFQVDKMAEEKHRVSKMLEQVHSSICKYHQEIKEKIWGS